MANTISIKIEKGDKKFLEQVMKDENLSSMVNAFHHIIMVYKYNTKIDPQQTKPKE